MPLDFPSSPTNGQYYNGFVYNAANETWDSAYAPRPATVPISTPNVIINGAMDIWQRGTSGSASAGSYGYGPDRFAIYSHSGTSGSWSQQAFTPGAAPVAGYEGSYFARFTSTSTSTVFRQPIEDVRTLAGQTVTLSFWMKAASAISVTSRYTQEFGTGGSSPIDTGSTTHSVTTSWARYMATVTLPSVTGKTIGAGSSLRVIWETSSINTSIDIWGVQLEAGAAATDFRRNAPSIQGELAACQRYYWRLASGSSYWVGAGWYYSASQVSINVQFPVTMRTAPTADISNGANHFYVDSSAGAGNIPTLSIYWPQPTNCLLYYPSSPAGTTGKAVAVNTSNAAAYVGFSAEL